MTDIPKCICEGDFDGEQTHRSNPMAVCPVCDDCEWCGKAKAGVLIGGTERVCAECDYKDRIARLEKQVEELKEALRIAIVWMESRPGDMSALRWDKDMQFVLQISQKGDYLACQHK